MLKEFTYYIIFFHSIVTNIYIYIFLPTRFHIVFYTFPNKQALKKMSIYLFFETKMG